MNIFKVVVMIILSTEALGTFVASCRGSEDCKTSDAIINSFIICDYEVRLNNESVEI